MEQPVSYVRVAVGARTGQPQLYRVKDGDRMKIARKMEESFKTDDVVFFWTHNQQQLLSLCGEQVELRVKTDKNPNGWYCARQGTLLLAGFFVAGMCLDVVVDRDGKPWSYRFASNDVLEIDMENKVVMIEYRR